jgi:capsular polysaccharide biosynthesis protein
MLMVMRVELKPIFGEVPACADNLEIVGAFPERFEEKDQATVWPASGVIRWKDGSIETETIWIKKHLEQCGDYHSKWSLFPKKKRGRFFNISLFWSQNYYHWICDVLVRLHKAISRLDLNVRVILPPGLTSWQKRSLELVGLPMDRCLQYSGKRPWKVECLVYASPVAMTGDHEAKSLLSLRDTIRQKLGCMPVKAGWRRLYLSRKNAPSRCLVNEDELLPVFKDRGFQVVDCGTMSLEEQVRLFSEAQRIVGPHGAAFTNVLWSPPGLKIFEIFEPGSVRRCYWSMSKVLGHEYFCGVGESVPREKGEPNIRVASAQIAAALDVIALK